MQTFKRFLLEIIIFIVIFTVLNKLFFYLEGSLSQNFVDFSTSFNFKAILFGFFILSVLFSEYIFRKNKSVIKPLKFMQTDKKKEKISLKQLIKQKEVILLISFSLFFYLTYENIVKLNDYSMQVLLIILVFYAPISTILEIRRKKK